MNEMRKLMETVEEGMFGKAPPSAVENEMTMDEITAIGEQHGINEDDDEERDEFDEPLVPDDIHAKIVADMAKVMPGYKPGAYGKPSDKANQYSVMAWHPDTGHEVDMIFNLDTMSLEGSDDHFMLDNPFESIEEGEEDKNLGPYEDNTEKWQGQSVKITGGEHRGETGKVIEADWEFNDVGAKEGVYTVKLYSGGVVTLYLSEWSHDQIELQYDPTHRPDGKYNPELEETFSDWVDDFTAPSDEREHRYDHDPSFSDEEPISAQVKSLLAQGKSVISRIGGASGVVKSADPIDGTIVFQDENFSKNVGLQVDNREGLEIQGNVDHYAIVQNVDEEIEEGKWDYKKRDKGRGAGTDSPMYDGGAKNRKARKAFRKKQKAEAHAARMRGEVDEDVADWMKRLDRKAADWIGAKAARMMAKKVANAVDEEGLDNIGFDLSYGDKKGRDAIANALETYLKNEPEGEYAEQIRYVLPVIAKERGKWDDIMQQAEKHLGIPADEGIEEDYRSVSAWRSPIQTPDKPMTKAQKKKYDARKAKRDAGMKKAYRTTDKVNEGFFSWAADKLMNTVVKEIDKNGVAAAASYLYTHHGDNMETFCDSLKVYLQDREPSDIGAEKYAKLIKLRSMLDCKDRIHEGVGRVVEVPPELRGDIELVGNATSEDVRKFLADLGPDDDVSHDVVDPETGELLDWPTKEILKKQDDEEMDQYWRRQGGTKRQKGKAKAKNRDEFYASFDDTPHFYGAYGSKDGYGEDGDYGIAWGILNELRDSDFYNVVWRDMAEVVGKPDIGGVDAEDWGDLDYDVEVELPVAIKRKDGQRFTDDDHDNFREVVKASKKGNSMGNFGISYVGTSDKGTVARFTPSFM